jgi:hypothetical protein
VTPQFHGFQNNVPLSGGVPDAARADKPMLDIVCPGCDARHGRVSDTERGPLLWLWHNDPGGHLPRDDLGPGPETAHVRFRFLDGDEVVGPITPEERFTERCPHCGALEVTGAEVLAGIDAYRSTGKLKRILARRVSAPEH